MQEEEKMLSNNGLLRHVQSSVELQRIIWMSILDREALVDLEYVQGTFPSRNYAYPTPSEVCTIVLILTSDAVTF